MSSQFDTKLPNGPSSKMKISYTKEQLLHVDKTMTFVPGIFYMQPDDDQATIGYGKVPILNDSLKRVYIAARHLTPDEEKKGDKARNSWVILLETASGNNMSVELKQVDGEGNTIVMYGQVYGFAYSKGAELMEDDFVLREFFDRVERYGLSRYKLRSKYAGNEDGVAIHDLRGYRFWIWSALRLLEPELPGFISDYSQSLLVKIERQNALDAEADWLHNGHFLPPKEKKSSMSCHCCHTCHHEKPAQSLVRYIAPTAPTPTLGPAGASAHALHQGR
ncbi:hypothetical protein PG994_008583 [Apiospora phragmitis]|uniref:Uncharacterized protein n=1 Tax=Apiospora phragmitis TaxID=2905665 RepID=A0ABR1UGU8_9PEZI